ncbi:hypothetical protein D9M68_620010 [compost metagenome]
MSAGAVRVKRQDFPVNENGVQQARKGVVRRAKFALVRDQVVVGAVNGPQSEWHLGVRHQGDQFFTGCVPLCDQDLFKDEFQIRHDE